MNPKPEPFGTVLGIAPGGVPSYSSHYPTADPTTFADREAYRSYRDGLFMGYKWQCVEFARRWLYINRNYTFDDIAMAYDIFELRAVRHAKDNTLLPLYAFRNGGERAPEAGALLIWNEGGEFEDTGHVAVITDVLPDRVLIAEQNFEHQRWPEGQHYARAIPMERDDLGGYWLDCGQGHGSIRGWVMQTNDDRHAEPRLDPDPQLFNPGLETLAPEQTQRSDWLNPDDPSDAAFLQLMGGPHLTSLPAFQRCYFTLTTTALHELKHATNELHAMYLHATHRVLRDDQLLARFNLPRSIWPKLRQSWNNRRNEMITGRFDFAVSERGIKVYEYNADSASCYLEAGQLQQRWFDAWGMAAGRPAGDQLHPDLLRAWRKCASGDLLHILQDDDLEETYHALFMKSAAEAAGLRCKVITGMTGLSWDAEGFVIDAEGERLLQVWKTWAWETALDQLRAECDEDEALAAIGAHHPREGAPRLVDILLRPEVIVYEPLWTLVPSNKAILPILWELFPEHPYLLNADYQLTHSLEREGYVVKPIAGRCGFNISLVDGSEGVLKETGGQFGEQEMIYQALHRLPCIDGLHVQVGTFAVDGKYAAACIRADSSPVITTHSDLIPLRIVDDPT